MSATVEFPSVQASNSSAIDWSKPFMPEHLTHLYHTPVWAQLSEEEQRRYVQLHALCIHEQIIFFERALAPNVLSAFLREAWPAELKAGLRTFLLEEERHSAMFWHLNRRCASQWYSNSMYHFIRVPAAGRAALNWMTHHPRLFPLCLWLMLLQEDRAMYYGKAFLQQPDIEPHFQAVQKAHLADETGHVRWDEQLLNSVWPQTPRLLRRINVWLCCRMIEEFFGAPKRAGLRVIEELVRQMPTLRPRKVEIDDALRALKHDAPFRQSLYSRPIVPLALAQMDHWPECAPLVRLLTWTRGKR